MNRRCLASRAVTEETAAASSQIPANTHNDPKSSHIHPEYLKYPNNRDAVEEDIDVYRNEDDNNDGCPDE